MNQLLKAGLTLTTETSRSPCRIETFLGGGGQGEVYRAALAGSQVAVKWYFPHTATPEQRRTLEKLVVLGPPDKRFLWPLEMLSDPALGGYGYVMPLREARYKGLTDLMAGRATASFRALATAGYELADSYFQLHAKGLCYRDISFGNVFFDPSNGNVLICDNDNVTVDGQQYSGVLGTMRFMAPEIVRGEAMPSRDTDRFSLAVLLFYLYMVHHPLEGQRETAIRSFDTNAMKKIYGTDPVFIFDPGNSSNRPDPKFQQTVLDIWEIYPTFIKELFVRAFTAGVSDPAHGRVKENEWRAALVRLRDSIFRCSHCKKENFYDADAVRANRRLANCSSCDKHPAVPFGLRIAQKSVVMLNPDTQLFPHHLDKDKPFDFGHAMAEVSRHPSNPNILGIKNLSPTRWVLTSADGTAHDVEPGKSIRLDNGVRIDFGGIEAEVRSV